MNQLITINNVNAYLGADGKVYLKLEDVARGLGLTQTKNKVEYIRWETVINYCKEFSQLVGKDDFIPENIFYKLCMKANNEVARKFQDLVCDEILPSIRKNGMYATENTIDQILNDPDFGIKLLTNLKEEKAKNDQLKTKINEDAPRVAYAENMEKSSDCILLREFSKVLANEGIILGEKKLYKWLREKGYILKNNTEPSQKAVEQELFKVSHGTVKTIKGDINTKTTKITGKGQIYFLDLIKKEFAYQIAN